MRLSVRASGEDLPKMASPIDRVEDEGVALLCEKTARNFRSIVIFAVGPCLSKFVRTA
jgi:hypothetical protein